MTATTLAAVAFLIAAAWLAVCITGVIAVAFVGWRARHPHTPHHSADQRGEGDGTGRLNNNHKRGNA